ncbi:MAG: radical SAM protein [Pseudomonadota bacterium]
MGHDFRYGRDGLISFSGGEALLRHDIAAILDYCGRRGIRTRVTSNGLLVPRKIDSIASLDVLKLSVDGTRETHEAMRGPGSFGALNAAIASASQRRLKVVFSTAITRINMKDCLFVLDLAAQHGTVVTFQPLERRRGLDEKQYRGLMPDAAAYRGLISFLMTEKAAGNRHIGNSLPGLFQLWRWPAPHATACHAGQVVPARRHRGQAPCLRQDDPRHRPAGGRRRRSHAAHSPQQGSVRGLLEEQHPGAEPRPVRQPRRHQEHARLEVTAPGAGSVQA